MLRLKAMRPTQRLQGYCNSHCHACRTICSSEANAGRQPSTCMALLASATSRGGSAGAALCVKGSDLSPGHGPGRIDHLLHRKAQAIAQVERGTLATVQ